MVHEVVFVLRMYDLFYRPNDSRMLVALGESYEKLSQQAEAKKVGCSHYSISPSKGLIDAPFLCSVTGGHTLLEM